MERDGDRRERHRRKDGEAVEVKTWEVGNANLRRTKEGRPQDAVTELRTRNALHSCVYLVAVVFLMEMVQT